MASGHIDVTPIILVDGRTILQSDPAGTSSSLSTAYGEPVVLNTSITSPTGEIPLPAPGTADIRNSDRGASDCNGKGYSHNSEDSSKSGSFVEVVESPSRVREISESFKTLRNQSNGYVGDSIELVEDTTDPSGPLLTRNKTGNHSTRSKHRASGTGELWHENNLNRRIPAMSAAVEGRVQFRAPFDGPVIHLRGREVVLAICVFVLLSVSIALILTIGLKKVGQSGEHDSILVEPHPVPLCVSTKCMHLSNSVLKKMNTSYNPCTSFWEYACGGWIRSHSLPQGRESWDVSKEVEVKIDKELKSLLETSQGEQVSQEAVWKARHFYKKCMDVNRIEGLGIAPIVDTLKKINGFDENSDVWIDREPPPSWDKNSALASLVWDYKLILLFTIWVAADDLVPEEIIIQFDQGGLGLESTDYNFPETAPVQNYRNYIRDLSTQFKARNVSGFVDDVISFERKLATFYIPITTDPDEYGKFYNKLTVQQLAVLSPKIDWLHFLQRVFRNVNVTTKVLLFNEGYFKNISELFDNAPRRQLNNYFVWTLIQKYAKHLSFSVRQAAQLYELSSEYIQPVERWKFCIGITSEWFGVALGYLYVQNYVDKENIQQVKEIIIRLQQTFTSSIKSCTWLNESTRHHALKKIQSMTYMIGYPEIIQDEASVNNYYAKFNVQPQDNYLDLYLKGIQNVNILLDQELESNQPIKRLEADIHPYTVMAFYSPRDNAILLQAGMLDEPHFYATESRAVNYGAIGSIMAHEIVHGFDRNGGRYDENGHLVGVRWWSPESWDEYENRTKCLETQLSNYHVDGVYLDGSATLDESLADIEGLRLAFAAFQTERDHVGSPVVLPGLHLTEGQLFFTAFAQNWCAVQTKERIAQGLRVGPHPPPQVRVDSSLSNVPEFSAAFGCQPGSPRNLKGPQCRLLV